MKLIIDISEEVAEYIKNNGCLSVVYNDEVAKAIQNGTPLEEHGRLIDADVLCDYFWDNRSKLYTHKDLRIVIDRQPTIIEADKGDNEDFNHEGFYNFLLNTIQPNEMEKYRNMFLSSGQIVN